MGIVDRSRLSSSTVQHLTLLVSVVVGCGTSAGTSQTPPGPVSDGSPSNPNSSDASSAAFDTGSPLGQTGDDSGNVNPGAGDGSNGPVMGGDGGRPSGGPPPMGMTDAGNPPTPDPNRTRPIMSMDDGWLFSKGVATGADQAAFADTAWRKLSVPHDWSIEGPFDAAAPTTAHGGFLPAGVAWYRKHFTLPANLASRRIFIEFDGVMANSDVYINGFHLGQRPSGYTSFRYDMTGHTIFGTAENVLAVRTDTSAQPASRWYTGAGINRHVRLIATDDVHVDQWATYVTTAMASAAAATVHLTTTVVNQGTMSPSVTVQTTLIDPSGTSLPPVTSTAQSVAAAASANFAIDIPVTNPKLWSIDAPSMYKLVTKVLVGGTAVDDDVTPVGIRTLKVDPVTGMNINGAGVKFKGVALHHDVSALGTAVPMRAWQRRLAQLKTLGVNAIRTAHNPFPPEVLDLCDQMGLLVLDEFFDAWVGHKPGITADYASYFPMWGTIDLTDAVKRDRNHPSVAMYSIGNEIRDSISTRAPIATNLVKICHTLDPSRPVTQALFQPSVNGDITGATRDILDVYGANYRMNEILQAMAIAPNHAGVGTEMANSGTADWSTVMSNAGLTGEFLWVGVDYLGEAGAWPTIGSGGGLLDRVGAPKGTGNTYQRLWGKVPVAQPPTGTSASKIVLTPDHASIVTDLNDLSYVKATIADASDKVVTSAANPVTFSITGPGTIVAVDSGSLTQESFRGNQRNAYQGVCFAIVQATGAGTITVTASSGGLTGGSATIQSTAGPFVPCSGMCD